MGEPLDHVVAWEGLRERLLVDTSETQPVYMLVGKNRRFIRLSATAYYLLKWHSEGICFSDMAERLGMTADPKALAEVEHACRRVIADVEMIEVRKPKKRFGFLFEVPFLDEKVVQGVVRHLIWLFHPSLVLALVAFVVAAMALFFQSGVQVRIVSHQEFWIGYAVLIATTLVHELGHAAACAHYGQPPSAIGFTIYLIYPALYSDVSSAWRLNRWQRVVVDVGGFYFQFIVAAVLALIYIHWRWEPAKIAVLGVLTSAIFSMNPILKMDGYWVMADALGVTNLADQPKRIFKLLWRRLFEGSRSPFPWSGSVMTFLGFYSVLMCMVWGVLGWHLGPTLIRSAATYPRDLQSMGHAIASGNMVGPNIYGFLMRTVSILFLGYAAFQFVLMLRSMVRAVLRKLGLGRYETPGPHLSKG